MRHAGPGRRNVLVVSCFATALLALPALAQRSSGAGPDSVPPGQQLRLEKGKGVAASVRVQFPDNWSEEPSIYVNSRKLVDVPKAQRSERRPSARIKIYSEQRLDHADALRQLQEFAIGVKADPKDFLTLAGWPAIQTSYVQMRSKPDRRPNHFPDPKVYRIATLIAAGDVLVRIDASLPSAPSQKLVAEARAIARSVALDLPGDPEAAQSELKNLQQGLVAGKEQTSSDAAKSALLSQLAATAPMGASATLPGEAGPGYNQRVFFSGFGEVEVAASPDGQNIALGKNIGVWVGSNDGGETFPSNGTVNNFNCGDPSMAWGQSGTFYYAGINCNCTAGGYTNFVAPASTFGYDCNGVASTPDNSLAFAITNSPMVICLKDDPNNPGTVPGACFPDQEHITADRANPGSGGDQVYSTWRNFDATDQDAAIVCSQDSGDTWTAPLDLGGNSAFPRIASGSDGFVYVVDYVPGWIRLHKLNSCANGLTIVPGFPINVVASPPNLCPFAGHDRCDQDPVSQTVAVDDTNPNHLYLGYSFNTSATNDNIVVRHSVDGGATWSGPVQANTTIPGERIMPWLCSTGGSAYLTWYDRRNAPVCLTPPCPGINNDRTDFYGAEVGVDFGGNLVALGDFPISEAPDNWCSSGWPCGTRSENSSESCSVQPQLAGSCQDTDNANNPVAQNIACDFSDCGGANLDIVFPSATCQCAQGDGTNIQCNTGGGCPKYGDYNGNACAAGRLYAAWASASSPAGVPLPTSGIGLLFDSLLVDEVPHLQVPGDVDFGTVCGSGTTKQTMNVCNTGTATLEVQPITSSNALFAVTRPSGGYPVRISPDFCFPFEVTFTPTGDGAQSGTLTIRSDDPVNPVTTVDVTATAANRDITTTFAPGGSFGDVCLGADRDLELTIHNAGGCPLSVSNITSNNAEFEVGAVGAFPLVIDAGDSVMVPVQFDPAGDVGVENANITIASNDPDTPAHVVAVTGNSPAAVIETFIGNAGSYGDVCVEAVFKELPLTIQNNGACPLDIDSVTLTGGDTAFFTLPAPTPTPTLEPLNSVVIPVRFTPTDFTVLARSSTVRVASRTLLATTALTDDDTAVSGNVPPPDINVPAAGTTQEFGNVCAGETATMEIPVCNTGACNLNVTGAALFEEDLTTPCDDFTIVGQPFPSVVSPDFCIPLTVQYTPTEEGTHTCVLVIQSNDPNESSVNVTVTATTPGTLIDVTESLTFLPEVVSSVDVCESRLPFPITNRGLCPLDITAMTVFENPAEFGLEGIPPSYPHPLQPGHSIGDGDLRAIFAPDQPLAREKTGILRTSYVSDSVMGTITDFDTEVCGEGVLTGARVLVTNGGTPVEFVERIQIQRVVGNRNRRPQLDTVSVVQNLSLQTYTPDDPVCRTFEYHMEYGTVTNPIQLLPGYYQVTATIKVGTRKYTKAVGFSVNSCDFNPSVVVTFATP